jgi:hypothetical protein
MRRGRICGGRCRLPLSEREVSPTEVVVVASEMIRVVDLNPFDLSMWYRRAR